MDAMSDIFQVLVDTVLIAEYYSGDAIGTDDVEAALARTIGHVQGAQSEVLETGIRCPNDSVELRVDRASAHRYPAVTPVAVRLAGGRTIVADADHVVLVSQDRTDVKATTR